MTASIIVYSRVAPELEAAFLKWESEVRATEQGFPGFLGHRVEHPTESASQEWTVIVAFDTEAHLDGWLGSPERQELLERAAHLHESLRLERTSYGFGFWNQNAAGARPSPHRIFKENLLVLLVLYPTIFLWGYGVGNPLFTDLLRWPWWAVLFVGAVASTQVLGWWLVPWAMRAFRRWLEPRPGWATELVGYAIVVVLSAAFMALYAWLIAAIGRI